MTSSNLHPVKTTVDIIKDALLDFEWTNYRFHDVADTIYDGEEEWADHLAKEITDAIGGSLPLPILGQLIEAEERA